jgi:hypothetical protein
MPERSAIDLPVENPFLFDFVRDFPSGIFDRAKMCKMGFCTGSLWKKASCQARQQKAFALLLTGYTM